MSCRFATGDRVYPIHHPVPGFTTPRHDREDAGTVTAVNEERRIAVVTWDWHEPDQDWNDVDEHDADTGVCRHHPWTIRHLRRATP